MQFNPLKRRAFMTLLGAATAWPLAVYAQAFDKRPRRITVLSGASRAALDKQIVAFLEGMRAHGYVEGRDFEMDYRLADGHIERISTLAEELVRSKPDLILAGITHAAVVANDVIKTTPIVCPLLADPVGLGLIKNDARPGGAVTGLRLFVEGLPSKQLEIGARSEPGRDQYRAGRQSRQRQQPEPASRIGNRWRSKGHQDRNYRGTRARRRRFDLPDAGERTGRCGYRTSGHTVLYPTSKIGGVSNGSTIAERVWFPRARRRGRFNQLRDQPVGELSPRSRLRG